MKKFWNLYKTIILIILIGLILGVGGIRLVNKEVKRGGEQLGVGKAVVWVEVRETKEERRQGLSGWEKLKADEGMLFVFEELGKYGFWMKEMKFDLDFVWIKGERVVEITEGVKAPEKGEEPLSVRPKVLVDKVLEVNVGWVKENEVKVGDMVSFRN